MPRVIIETVEGNAPECPECGNWNAMLEHRRIRSMDVETWLVCRDCGYQILADNVTLRYKELDKKGMGKDSAYHFVRDVNL